MGKPSDRDSNYMYKMWGTTKLITDYQEKTQKIEEKRHNFEYQNKIHEKIRNDEDYDDWDYGTEPLYGEKLNK